MSNDERQAALRANIAAYGKFDERSYVNGAPHLKHPSIAQIYAGLVKEAIATAGRDPKTLRVLELGAGNGLASAPWFEARVKLTAVDSSDAMLGDLQARAAAYGAEATAIVADAVGFLTSNGEKFDIVTHVSMLHHIPDYLQLLALSAAHVNEGGCLLTFQDPLRYDRMPFGQHFADRLSYFIWRAAQGNVRRGLNTRWRRLRGVYSPRETVDFDEYHVVRNGVDSEAIVDLLARSFSTVRLVPYWSTYSRWLQSIGEQMPIASSFGVIALGRRTG